MRAEQSSQWTAALRGEVPDWTFGTPNLTWVSLTEALKWIKRITIVRLVPGSGSHHPPPNHAMR